MLSNSDSLKRYLFHLPANSEFKFTNELKRDIRKALFWAASSQGQFLDWVFPLTFQQAAQQNQNQDQSESSTFSEAIKRIEDFNWLFTEYCKATLSKKVHNHHAFHLNLPCARIFRKGEPIYRCLTCGFDDTCALCSNCYLPENHEGHKVHITICLRENGGVCDCGDPEAWVKEYVCPYASQDKDTPQQKRDTPAELQKSFLETIEILLDYVIDVMSQCDLHFENPLEMEPNRIEISTHKSCLDPTKYGYPDTNEATRTLDRSSDKYYLMVYNDQIRHYRDAVQRIYHASKKVPQFAVMVTEKVQNYGKAKVISSSDIKLLQDRQKVLSSTGLATCIRLHRDIFREDMVDEILKWIYELTESDMFKSNFDFKNLICKAFIGRWNNGLLNVGDLDGSSSSYSYKVGTLDPFLKIPKIPSAKNYYKDQPGMITSSPPSHWDFTPSKWELKDDICNECDYNLTEEDYQPDVSHLGSRFQYFIYLDIRFWKSIRSLLHDMYSTSLITNLQYKFIISCQYVDIYPGMADMFLTMDREPEMNVMCTLSTQLFTCPTNSTSIVKHGDLSRIFASIYGFLTTEEIRSPDNIELSHEISLKSLKNRRWGQIFFDIGYILSRSKQLKTILTGNIIPMACDILALFQGRPVMKRESKNHIEYENPDYTAFFHAILVIYQFAWVISSCLSNLEKKDKLGPEEMKSISNNVIDYVIQFLLKLENNDYPGLIDEFVDIHLSDDKTRSIRTITEEIEGSVIQKYDIDKEKVSFLHPIHSFLSWLMEVSNFSSADEIKSIFEKAARLQSQCQQLQSITGASSGITESTPIFEYPIRTIVLMSQIKSGFWVRNGFSVRSQLQLYRNTLLRESGYMRDLFLIQVFINTNSPNLVCFLLLNRWLLLDGWINNDGPAKLEELDNSGEEVLNETECSYDKNTLPYMIEECLNFFIHVLTEDLYLRNLSNEKISELRIRNEIIHNLCFGAMNYTKLCAQIPDHITSEKKFDMILEDMSTFVSPSGSKDIGVYKLKEENFDKLNPYYFNYTTNTKDDAIKFVKDREHKKTGKPKNEIVVKPKIHPSEGLGAYKFIGNFAVSIYFQKFMIKTLKYILQEGAEKTESLLETVLHLIHICSYENTIDVEKYGTFYDIFIQKLDTTSVATLLYQFLCTEAFKDHHSKIRSVYKVFEKHGKYPLYSTLEATIPDFNFKKLEENDTTAFDENEQERKKRIAKDRQKKLMAKFKKQQTLFLEKNKANNLAASLNANSTNPSSTTTSVSTNPDFSDIDMEIDTDPDDESDLVGWKFPEPHCLLCQNAAEDAGPFGIITSISKSSEFRTVPFEDDYWFLKSFSDNACLDLADTENKPELNSSGWNSYMNQIKDNNVVGPGFTLHENVDNKLVSSSCGHGMHFQCYLNYLNTSRGKLNQITRNMPENIDQKEFLCPLCKSINNMFMPILWSSNKKKLSTFLNPSPETAQERKSPFEDLGIEVARDKEWFENFLQLTNLDILDSVSLTQTATEMIEQHTKEISINSNQLSSSSQSFRLLLSNMFQTLSLLTFPQSFKVDSTAIFVNTIKSAEIGLRGVPSNGSLVISQLSNNSLINLRTLNEFRNTSLLLKSKLPMDKNQRLELYIKLLANLLFLSKDDFNVSILERDFFEILVTIFPLPRSGFDFNSILRICIIGQVIQNFNIICSEIVQNKLFQNHRSYSILDVPSIGGISDDAALVCTNIFKRLQSGPSKKNKDGDIDITDSNCVDCHIGNEVEFGKVIYSMVLKATTPFYRRAAIYAFSSCADTENMDLLLSDEEGSKLEADRICKFMHSDLFAETVMKFSEQGTLENTKFNLFLNHLESAAGTSKQPQGEVVDLRKKLEYPGLIRLIDLPERLDFFFTNYYYLDIYDNPHRCIENPAICLFCGKVVDVQKSALGCKEGQCTTHYRKECSNSIGIFLLPKERCVLLLHKNGGSFYNAPYLDQHGELASESKRMKTLYLMKSRYDDFIRNVWLQHDIPNYVARKLDSVMDAGGWDTL